VFDSPDELLVLLEKKVQELESARLKNDAKSIEGRSRLIIWCMEGLADYLHGRALSDAQAALADTLFGRANLTVLRALDDPESDLALFAKNAPWRKPSPGSRRTHCWHCQQPNLDSAIHQNCSICDGIRCPHCGSCLCNFI